MAECGDSGWDPCEELGWGKSEEVREEGVEGRRGDALEREEEPG